MKERITVFLAFYGFGPSPSVVTSLVGIEPTRSHGEGEILKRIFVSPPPVQTLPR